MVTMLNKKFGGLKMNKRILALAVILSAFAATAQENGENVTIEGVYRPKITKFDKEKMALSYSAYEYNDNGDVVRIENHNRDEVDPSVLRTISAIEYQIEY